jgi:hypothetical protein
LGLSRPIRFTPAELEKRLRQRKLARANRVSGWSLASAGSEHLATTPWLSTTVPIGLPRRGNVHHGLDGPLFFFD